MSSPTTTTSSPDSAEPIVTPIKCHSSGLSGAPASGQGVRPSDPGNTSRGPSGVQSRLRMQGGPKQQASRIFRPKVPPRTQPVDPQMGGLQSGFKGKIGGDIAWDSVNSVKPDPRLSKLEDSSQRQNRSSLISSTDIAHRAKVSVSSRKPTKNSVSEIGKSSVSSVAGSNALRIRASTFTSQRDRKSERVTVQTLESTDARRKKASLQERSVTIDNTIVEVDGDVEDANDLADSALSCVQTIGVSQISTVHVNTKAETNARNEQIPGKVSTPQKVTSRALVHPIKSGTKQDLVASSSSQKGLFKDVSARSGPLSRKPQVSLDKPKVSTRRRTQDCKPSVPSAREALARFEPSKRAMPNNADKKRALSVTKLEAPSQAVVDEDMQPEASLNDTKRNPGDEKEFSPDVVQSVNTVEVEAVSVPEENRDYDEKMPPTICQEGSLDKELANDSVTVNRRSDRGSSIECSPEKSVSNGSPESEEESLDKHQNPESESPHQSVDKHEDSPGDSNSVHNSSDREEVVQDVSADSGPFVHSDGVPEEESGIEGWKSSFREAEIIAAHAARSDTKWGRDTDSESELD